MKNIMTTILESPNEELWRKKQYTKRKSILKLWDEEIEGGCNIIFICKHQQKNIMSGISEHEACSSLYLYTSLHHKKRHN